MNTGSNNSSAVVYDAIIVVLAIARVHLVLDMHACYVHKHNYRYIHIISNFLYFTDYQNYTCIYVNNTTAGVYCLQSVYVYARTCAICGVYHTHHTQVGVRYLLDHAVCQSVLL